MVHQGDLSKEVAIASESIRQFCSIVWELILLRSILRSDNDRTYFDSRLKHYCQESLAILNILQGLKINISLIMLEVSSLCIIFH